MCLGGAMVRVVLMAVLGVLAACVGVGRAVIALDAGTYSAEHEGLRSYNAQLECPFRSMVVAQTVQPSAGNISIPARLLTLTATAGNAVGECSSLDTYEAPGTWLNGSVEKGLATAYADAPQGSLGDGGLFGSQIYLFDRECLNSAPQPESGAPVPWFPAAWEFFRAEEALQVVFLDGPIVDFVVGEYFEMRVATPASDIEDVRCAFVKADPSVGGDSDGGGGKCFPAHALVELRSGRKVHIAALQHGDEVRVAFGEAAAADADNFSPVFFFSHRETALSRKHRRTQYVRLAAAHGSQIELTESHLVVANKQHAPRDEWRMVAAREIAIGDKLRTARGVEVVTRVDRFVGKLGLYNPHTLSGSIVVDGVVASCYTEAVDPRLAQILLAPLRLAYRAFGAATMRYISVLDRHWNMPPIALAPLLAAKSEGRILAALRAMCLQ